MAGEAEQQIAGRREFGHQRRLGVSRTRGTSRSAAGRPASPPARPRARKVPNGSAYFIVPRCRAIIADADERSGERGQHEREQHLLPAEEGADHRQHLHVAHAEPVFLAARSSSRRRWRRARRRRARAPSTRGPPTRRADQREGEADDDAGQGDDVGQDLVLEVDGEQHDERAAEQQPRRQQRRRPA